MGLFDGATGGIARAFSGNPGDTPGTSGFKANPYQLDPNAFKDPNAPENRAMLLQAMQQSQGFTGSQPWQQNQAGQNDLMAALRDTAAGTGPNPAQAQFAQNVNTANQGAMSLAASGQGGVNPALALRQAMTTQQGNLQGAAGQAATLQAQQQIAAQQQLSAALGQQQTGQLNAQQIQQQGGQGYGNLIQNQSQQQTANQIAQQTLASGNYNSAMGLNQNTATNNANAYGNLVGGVIGGAGAALANAFSEGGPVSKAAPALPAAFAATPMAPGPVHMTVGGSVEDMTAQATAQNAALAASFMHLPTTPLKAMDLSGAGQALGTSMKNTRNVNAGLNSAGLAPDFATNMTQPGMSGPLYGGNYETGGGVQGPGTEHSDSVPAMLSKNEFVDSAPMVHELGPDLLNQLNEESKLAYALRSVGRHKAADMAAPHVAALKAAMSRKAA